MPSITIAQARRAKSRLRDLVGSDENVVGIGLTKAKAGYALKLNLRSAARQQGVPASIDGVPVVSEIVGTLRARSK